MTAEERDFLNRIQNAEAAWKKWWDLLWQNTTYPLATLLNPVYRTKWFKDGLKHMGIDQKTIEEVLNRTRQAWIHWHQQKQQEEQLALSNSNDSSAPRKRRRTTYLLRTINSQSIYDLNQRVFGDWKSNDISEYEEYLNQPVLPPSPGFEPLAWWCEQSQQIKWPHLSSLAVSVLSFPAMSAEAERVFSGARRTISWERSQLKPETIEVLECLKYILRSKHKAK